MFLSLRLPQFKCRSSSFRPNRVSFLHCQCWSLLFSSHSKRRTFTQSLISAAPRQSLSLILRTRDSEAQRNCCSLARGSHWATVIEVALSTFMHLLWFSLKIRKEPVSGAEKNSFIGFCFFERFYSEVKLNRQEKKKVRGYVPMSAVMWRTCRSPRSTAKLDHSDIILSASDWWRGLQECVQVMGEGIWCVQRCVTYSSNDTHGAFLP